MKSIIHPCLGNDFFKTFITLYRYDLFRSSYTTHRSKNRNGLQSKHNLIARQVVKIRQRSNDCTNLESISIFFYCVPVIDVNDLPTNRSP